MRTVLAAAAFCAATALAAPMAQAVDFADMPVGCQWTFQYWNGMRLTHTYVGRVSGLYDVRTTVAGHPDRLVNNMWFNRSGDMVERASQNGKWEKFSPASCYTQVGHCEMLLTNARGVHRHIDSTTQRNGNHYDQYWHLRGRGHLHHVAYTEGRFGIIVKGMYRGKPVTVSRFRHCGR